MQSNMLIQNSRFVFASSTSLRFRVLRWKQASTFNSYLLLGWGFLCSNIFFLRICHDEKRRKKKWSYRKILRFRGLIRAYFAYFGVLGHKSILGHIWGIFRAYFMFLRKFHKLRANFWKFKKNFQKFSFLYNFNKILFSLTKSCKNGFIACI